MYRLSLWRRPPSSASRRGGSASGLRSAAAAAALPSARPARPTPTTPAAAPATPPPSRAYSSSSSSSSSRSGLFGSSFFTERSSIGSALALVEKEARAAAQRLSSSSSSQEAAQGEQAPQTAFAACNQKYQSLLADSMHSNVSSRELLRILHSWFGHVPAAFLPPHQRSEAVADLLRHFYIRWRHKLGSKIVDPLPASYMKANWEESVQALSGSGQVSGLQLGPAFGDVQRDVLLARQLPLTPTLLQLMCQHAATLKDVGETNNLLLFLQAYQKMALQSAAAKAEAKQAAKAATLPVTSLSTTLHIDINAFNALLDIYVQHGDEAGGMQLFAQLSPSLSPHASSSAASLLFSNLHPNSHTYTSLLKLFAQNNRLENAYSLLAHVKSQVAAWAEMGGAADAPDAPRLDIGMAEELIRTLVKHGHTHSAILVLQKMQTPAGEGAQTNALGLPPPSPLCFQPLLLDIPRFKSSPSSPASSGGRSSFPPALLPNPFDQLSADEQLQLLGELYSGFRSYGYQLPDDQLLVFVERVALMHSGLEVVGDKHAHPAATAAAPVSGEVEGLGERHLRLVSHPLPPPPTPKFSNPQAPQEFVLSVLNDRLTPAAGADGVAPPPAPLSLSSFNSLLFLFGVVLGQLDYLQHFMGLMQQLSLSPNAHSMNILMEAYGKAGMTENVMYMFQQIKAAHMAAMEAQQQDPKQPLAFSANVQSFNGMLIYALKPGATPSASPFEQLPSLLADMRSMRVAPSHSTWLMALHRLLEASGHAQEAQLQRLLPDMPQALANTTQAKTAATVAPVAAGRPAAAAATAQQTSALAAASSAALLSGSSFAHPLQEQQGIVFQIFQLLTESQQAAAAAAAAAVEHASVPAAASSPSGSPSPLFSSPAPASSLLAGLPSSSPSSAASPSSPSSSALVSTELCALFLAVSSKMGDVRSTLLFLQAMQTAIAQANKQTTTSLATDVQSVARALPAPFCRAYFQERSHLRAQLQMRLSQLDWQSCVSLLRVWQQAHAATNHSSHPPAAGSVSTPVDTDSFSSIIRRISHEEEMNRFLQACFDQLVWGWDTANHAKPEKPLSLSSLPLSARQSAVSHLLRALLMHSQFPAMISFLDLVADMNNHMRQESKQLRLKEVAFLPLQPRVLQEVMQAVAKQQGQGLATNNALPATTSSSTSSPSFDLSWHLNLLSRLSPRGRWFGLVPLEELLGVYQWLLTESLSAHRPVSDLSSIFTQALEVQKELSFATEDDRLATSAAQLRHPAIISMANQLLLSLSTPVSPLPSAYGVSSLSGAVRRTSADRIAYLEQLLEEMVAVVEEYSRQHAHGVPQLLPPLLDAQAVSQAITFAMEENAPRLVSLLWHYAAGMATPNLRYYEHDKLLNPPQLQPLPKAETDTEESTSSIVAEAMRQEHKPKRAPQYLVLPDTLYEQLLHFCMGRLATPPLHPAFNLQLNSPSQQQRPLSTHPVEPNPALGWEIYCQLSKERRAISTNMYRSLVLLQSCYPPPSSSPSSSPSPLGRNQLMYLWKELQDRLPWYEALWLLPYVQDVLVRTAFLPSAREDLHLKQVTMAMLTRWANMQRDKKMPLPAVQGGAGALRQQQQQQAAAEGVQMREEKKLSALRASINSLRAELEQTLNGARQELTSVFNLHTNIGTTATPTAAKREKKAAPVKDSAAHVEAELHDTNLSSASRLTNYASSPAPSLSGSLPAPLRRSFRFLPVYQKALSKLSRPHLAFSDNSMPMMIRELIRHAPEFVALTNWALQTGKFADTKDSHNARAGRAERTAAHVYFDFMRDLLHLMHCKGFQMQLIQLMAAIAAEPQGLQICLAPGTVKRNATAQPPLSAAPFPAPLDVTLHWLEAMLERKRQSQTWKRVAVYKQAELLAKEEAYDFAPAGMEMPSQQVNGLAANVATAHKSASTSSSSSPLTLRSVPGSDLLYSSHGSWWLLHSLYWHFRVHHLPSSSFDPALLFVVPRHPHLSDPPPHKVVSMESETGKHLAKAVRWQGPTSPFAITPRTLHQWVMKQDIDSAKQITQLAYERAFQFHVHQVNTEQEKEKKSGTFAQATDALFEETHTESAFSAAVISLAKPATANAPVAPASPASPPTSGLAAAAHSLHFFTFHLFKYQYSLLREQLDPFAPLPTNRTGTRSLRTKKSLAEWEKTLHQYITSQKLDIGAEEMDRLQQEAAQPQPPPTVYQLFHRLSALHPHALSENVYNIVVASLFLFARTGLSADRHAALRSLLQQMQLLNYRVHATTASYIVDACVEQAMMEAHGLQKQAAEVAGKKADASTPFSRARDLLMFASDLLEEQHLPRTTPAFDFGSAQQGRGIPTAMPTFPVLQ